MLLWLYGVHNDGDQNVFSFFVGSGILTEADGSVYEGGFHNNARHGEGVQLYRYLCYVEHFTLELGPCL